MKLTFIVILEMKMTTTNNLSFWGRLTRLPQIMDRVIAAKMTTTVPVITRRITVAQRIPGFWQHSKNQCTLENGKGHEEFDEAALMLAVARVAIGSECFEARASQWVLRLGIERKGAK